MNTPKRAILFVISMTMVLALILSACAPAVTPTPEQIIVTKEVVVTKEVQVEKTVVVQPTAAPAVATEAPKIKLSLAGFGPGEAAFQPVWNEIKTTYEAKNPNVELDLIGLAYENLRTQLIVQSTAGTAPCIGQVDSILDLELASLGATTPLDDLMSPEFKKDILPSLLQNSTYNGKVYAIPQSPVPHILWENTALAQKAGLDPKAKIATFDDLANAARAIKKLKQDEQGNPIWGWSIDTSWPLIVAIQTYPILKGFGCDWFDANGNVTITDTKCTDAVNWFKGLVTEGIVGPPGVDIRETRNTFGKSLSGFQVDNTGAVGIYRDLSGLGADFDSHWRLVDWPGKEAGKGVGVYYAHSFVVFEQCKAKQEAVKFIEWLLTDKDMYGKYFDATGAPPPTLSLLDGDPKYATPYIQTIKDQMGSWARPAPMFPSKFNEISNFIGYAISQAVIQNVDAKKALADAAANIHLMFR